MVHGIEGALRASRELAASGSVTRATAAPKMPHSSTAAGSAATRLFSAGSRRPAAAPTAAAAVPAFVRRVPFRELKITERNVGRGLNKAIHTGVWNFRPVAIQQMPADSCSHLEPDLVALVGRHANLLAFFGQVRMIK
jgi:hypothetical protein